MTRTINQEIENALTYKGYKWKNISITPLTQARWSWMKEQDKYKSFSKEDALVYILELLDSNSIDFDLTKDEYEKILDSVY